MKQSTLASFFLTRAPHTGNTPTPPPRASQAAAPSAAPRPPPSADSKAPAARKAASKPRLPADLDDDEKVDAYVFKLQRYEDEQENRALQATAAAGAALDDRVQALVTHLQKIVANAAAGDCIYPLSELRLYITMPDKVMAATDSAEPWLAPSALLEGLMCTRKDFAAAVPDLVAEGVRLGKISTSDTRRLTDLWRIWVAGVGWAQCRLSPTNRPSLASWRGSPWDEEFVMERCLYRGVPAQAAKAIPTDGQCLPYPMVVEHADLAQVLWSSKSGPADVEAVVRSCLVNMRARYAEPKKAKNAGKKRKAAAGH